MATFASATVGKFSTRQYRGPAGNSLSFFSATGLTTYFCCATAVDGDSSNPIAQSESVKTIGRLALYVRSFIILLLRLIVVARRRGGHLDCYFAKPSTWNRRTLAPLSRSGINSLKVGELK